MWSDTCSLYRHAVWFGTLDQDRRKNEILKQLAGNFRNDTYTFGPLLVERLLLSTVNAGSRVRGALDLGLQTRAWMLAHFFSVGYFQPGLCFCVALPSWVCLPVVCVVSMVSLFPFFVRRYKANSPLSNAQAGRIC